MISRTAALLFLTSATSVFATGVRGRHDFHKIPMVKEFDCSAPCKNGEHSTDGLRGEEMAKCLVEHCGSFYGDVQVPLADDFIYDNFNYGQCKVDCEDYDEEGSVCLDVCECKRSCWIQRGAVPRRQRVCAETCSVQFGQISAPAMPHFHS